MSEYVSRKDRELIIARAENRCEYCRMPQQFALFTFQVDHIVSLKHGGQTSSDNLAWSCGCCNANKGTDLGTMLDDSDVIVRFYHDRKDLWLEHFEVSEGFIYPKTKIGRATVKIFRFNDVERILERKLLIEGGFW